MPYSNSFLHSFSVETTSTMTSIVLCGISVFLLTCAAFPTDFEKPNERAGKSLTNWANSNAKGNPEEQGNYFEGDIIAHDFFRSGVRDKALKWPNAKIPYKLGADFTSSEKNMISDAMDLIKRDTCVKFSPWAGEKDYVLFKRDNLGCFSSVGKVGGEQIINLQPECLVLIGTPAHEIMHALGFYHEQNRSDRDESVSILAHNIVDGKMVNFDKVSSKEIDTFGINYDYESVMHYSKNAFSKNGQPTIEAKKSVPTASKMGQRVKLSDLDIKKIKKMYC
jgi:hypothetical protein